MNKDIYKSAIDSSPFGFACYKLVHSEKQSFDFELIEANKAFSDATGIRLRSSKGKDAASIFPFDLGAEEGRLKLIGDIAQNGGSCEFWKYSFELQKDLRIKVISAQNQHVALIISDCCNERKLFEGDQINSLLTDKLVIWAMDLSLRFKYVSPSIIDGLGYSIEEIIKLQPEKIMPEGSLRDAMRSVEMELAIEKQGTAGPDRSWILQLEFTNKKGLPVWAESTIKFLRDAKQKPVGLIGYSRNITKQIRAQEALKQSEEHLRLILDSTAEGIYGIDKDGNCTFCNASCLKLLCYENETELLGQNMYTKIRSVNPKESCGHLQELGSHTVDELFYRADGTLLPVECFSYPQYRDGTVIGAVVTFYDISLRKKAERELRESERSKATLLSNIPGMAYRCKYDRKWTMQFVSEGCFALTGYKPESLLENRDVSFENLIMPEYRDYLWDKWSTSLMKCDVVKEEYPIMTASGKTKWVFEQGRGVYDENGDVEALEGLIIDITDRKKKEEDIQYLNYHDVLTGLYNRFYFEQTKARLDIADRLPLSILVGDINGLKLINDAFGHAKGDKLIVETAKLLKSCCKESDVLARTGGDEFYILMPQTDSAAAYGMMMKIQTACSIYNRNSTSEAYSINISLGFATKISDDENFNNIIKAAEDHMYKRKLLEHKSSHSAIISAIKATMFEKSKNTQQHVERIAKLSKKLGISLHLSQGDLDDLVLLATLHDIGKVGINENILNKPGSLNDEEREDVRKHPEIGYRIAMASPELVSIADYILTHQERWDGSGYPLGLSGENIPLLSRIIAIVDSYDSVTHDKPYRKALSKQDAMEEIRKNAGIQFDPNITEKFLDMVLKTAE